MSPSSFAQTTATSAIEELVSQVSASLRREPPPTLSTRLVIEMPRMGRINTPLDPLYPALVLGFLTAGITQCLWHVGAQAETGYFFYISIWYSQLYALLGGRR
jgi:hypothetical protein